MNFARRLLLLSALASPLLTSMPVGAQTWAPEPEVPPPPDSGMQDWINQNWGPPSEQTPSSQELSQDEEATPLTPNEIASPPDEPNQENV